MTNFSLLMTEFMCMSEVFSHDKINAICPFEAFSHVLIRYFPFLDHQNDGWEDVIYIDALPNAATS